jgi:AcrR family transcriptional regulator
LDSTPDNRPRRPAPRPAAAVGQEPDAPGAGRRERRKAEVRRRILEAARALFHTQGFEATPVEQIAAAADVAPATFFNHFHSKQALLGLLAGEVVERVGALLAEHLLGRRGTTRARLLGFARAAAGQIGASRRLARDVVLELLRSEARPDQAAPYLARVHEPFAALLKEGQRRGEVRRDRDAGFLAEMVVGALNAALGGWLADPDYPIETRLVQAAGFAWDAVAAAPRRGKG